MATRALASSRSDTTLATILLVAFLGVGALFVTGFAHSATLHDAAHNTRHSIGFPCH